MLPRPRAAAETRTVKSQQQEAGSTGTSSTQADSTQAGSTETIRPQTSSTETTDYRDHND